MEKLKRMDMMVKPDGSTMTIEEYKAQYYTGASSVEVFKNRTYLVIKSLWPAKIKTMSSVIWLSIKRNDKEPIHDWRDMQEIKNQVVGRYYEMVELYPSESRRVDCANQFHTFGFDDMKFRFPFGFNERLIGSAEEAAAIGAKQRPLESKLREKCIAKYRAILARIKQGGAK